MKAEGVAPGPGPAARIVVIVPYAEAVTGGVLADLTLARELTSLGRDVDVVAFLRRPQPRSVRYALDHLTFSLRLIGRFHGEPERHLYLEDQALSNVILPFNWYARWWRRERVALLTHHLGYSLRHPLRRVLRRWIDGVVARRADLLLAPTES
ncbi:MAG: hypothetical protein JOZ41_19120, partial [Chloroflexi bacterium]|nr:hypothetical protein [Chloroflexota bacterium]